MTAQMIDEQYPNLIALSQGCMSGKFSEWPQLRVEAQAILATLQSIKDAGDVVEPPVCKNIRAALGATNDKELRALVNYIDTLIAQYKRVCVERDEAKNYVADKEVEPTRIEFANGRVVVAVGGHLDVEK